MLLPRPILVLAIAVLASGCTAPNVTATIEGEPVCPDFEIGATRALMKGGLRKPVQVRVLEDGDDLISERTLLGKRNADAKTPKVLVHDTDDTYTIEWAQCPNIRAPRPVRSETRGFDEVASYACGEAKAYASRELKVRKGDPSSRVIQFVPPPEPGCWVDSVPASEAKDAGADASAEAGAEPAASAVPEAGTATPETTSTPSEPAGEH